ncbi:MAG: helix-turn-helix transcriptional regulator [Elusimicrobiota bacterium]|jgi:transcriptional regulator with XRE-family HTH domain
MALEPPFAARVAEGMRDRGLSLRALCREADIDPSYFSKVLAGKRSPPSEEAVLRSIARILRLDPVELVVSAGRIPEEWGALWADPELFRDIHARASGGRLPARVAHSRPEPKPAAAPRLAPQIPAAGRLSEELL